MLTRNDYYLFAFGALKIKGITRIWQLRRWQWRYLLYFWGTPLFMENVEKPHEFSACAFGYLGPTLHSTPPAFSISCFAFSLHCMDKKKQNTDNESIGKLWEYSNVFHDEYGGSWAGLAFNQWCCKGKLVFFLQSGEWLPFVQRIVKVVVVLCCCCSWEFPLKLASGFVVPNGRWFLVGLSVWVWRWWIIGGWMWFCSALLFCILHLF